MDDLVTRRTLAKLLGVALAAIPVSKALAGNAGNDTEGDSENEPSAPTDDTGGTESSIEKEPESDFGDDVGDDEGQDDKFDPEDFADTDGNAGNASDVRLKRDVQLLDRLENGLGIYRYRYLWSDEVYVGVMAQEVEKTVPQAAFRAPDGYLRVDYRRLGLRLMRWDEWLRTRSLKALAA